MKKTLIALATVALATACSSAASSPSHRTSDHTTQSTHSTPSPRHPTPHEPTVVISEKDAGHVVHVHRGDLVRWMLHSTYWTMRPAKGGELYRLAHGMGVLPPGAPHSCVAGQGCGTVEMDYRAVQAGRVTLSAHRLSCGEAMRCVGDQGRFSVTVIVT